MIASRTAIALLLSATAAARAGAGNDIGKILAAHPVWIQEGLAWQQDPGDKKQTWADGEILYFGLDGTFAIFGGVIIRRGAKRALSEGEGEIVQAGTWNVKDGVIRIDYRLVGMYKVLRPTGEKAPDIPGAVKHVEVKPDSTFPPHLQFEDRKYEIASGFRASELRSRLQIYAPANGARPSAPK